MFGYGGQDIIKYKKIYFIFNIYFYQTYIFKNKKQLDIFFALVIKPRLLDWLTRDMNCSEFKKK